MADDMTGISLDEAVTALSEPNPDNAVEPEVKEDAPQSIDAESEPEEVTVDGNEAEDEEPEEVNLEDEQDEEEVEPEQPTIDAPQYWDEEQKATFAQWPADVQEAVLSIDKTRQAHVTRAQMEAAERTKAADAQVKQLGEFVSNLEAETTTLTDMFKSRWEGVDWVALSNQDPQTYLRNQALYNAEKQAIDEQLEKVKKSKTDAQDQLARANMQYVEKEFPDLTDPVKGEHVWRKLATEVNKFGIDPAELKFIRPGLLKLLHDGIEARDNRNALSKRKAKPAPKVVKSKGKIAGKANSLGKTRAVNRFNKSNSLDDAVAVLLAGEQA